VCNTVGRVIDALTDGKPVFGVTSIDNQLYVFRDKSSQQIEVYDIDSNYCLQRCLNVPGCGAVHDIVACGHNGCIYVSDTSHIHRVRVAWAFSIRATPKWPVNENGLLSLSLTVKHNLLVTCCEVRKIKEFTTSGQLIREIVLPQDVCSPWHTVQLSSGELIVCHGDPGDPLHRVCQIGSDGQVVKSYGGPPGAGSQQMRVPVHMAVDGNDFIFVADQNNCRVFLLSPSVTYVREVVSREQLQRLPRRLSVDVQRRRLYVAENEYKDGKPTAGRVVVVDVY